MSKCIRIDTNCQSSPAALWRNHLRPITQRVQMIRPPLAHGDARLPVFAAAHRPAARHPRLVMPTRSMASGLNVPLSLRKVEAAARKPCEVMSCCESPMRRKPRASCSRWWVASRCEGPPAPVRRGRCGSGLQAFKDGQRLPWRILARLAGMVQSALTRSHSHHSPKRNQPGLGNRMAISFNAATVVGWPSRASVLDLTGGCLNVAVLLPECWATGAQKSENSANLLKYMVPLEGFEPPTPSLRMRCSTS